MSYVKEDSGVVLNTDISEYERYKLRRKQLLREKDLEQRVESLEKQIIELKNIMLEIHNRKS